MFIFVHRVSFKWCTQFHLVTMKYFLIVDFIHFSLRQTNYLNMKYSNKINYPFLYIWEISENNLYNCFMINLYVWSIWIYIYYSKSGALSLSLSPQIRTHSSIHHTPRYCMNKRQYRLLRLAYFSWSVDTFWLEPLLSRLGISTSSIPQLYL